MRIHTLVAGVALAALTPAIANAATCEEHRSGRIAATVGGGAGGALLGSAVAGRGSRTEGAVIGGILGAIAGNQIAKGSANCSQALGYYDNDGNWRPTGLSPDRARGYFDRNGDWVEGYPTGFYDNGQYVAVAGSSSDAYGGGYVDSNGNYVPAGVGGYYDRNGRWVGVSANGYYDNGRWVQGSARGYYDSRGRWVADNSYNKRGWDALEAQGYYDTNGRWVSGRTYGYYDRNGRWNTVSRPGYAQGSVTADNRDYRDGRDWRDGRRNDRYDWSSMPQDANGRIARLRDYLDGRGSARLSSDERSYARRELGSIEAQQRMYIRSDGRLTVREEAQIDTRLDRLTRRIERLDSVASRY